MGGTEDAVTVTREVEAAPEAVWQVLADGWAYAQWVVGASRVRAVDHDWPAEGSRIHHSFGLWPVVINDTTVVRTSNPPNEMALTARGWPAGEADVVITVKADGPGQCTVRIAEDAVSGPGTLVPRMMRQAVIAPRNREALRRLAYLSERRDGPEATTK
ncbi:MAG TPA: SRPBCC family protein [Dermatophilaceae bacterium]|nr:SRPBCC family protein [Dermatophilaceae bacterium]